MSVTTVSGIGVVGKTMYVMGNLSIAGVLTISGIEYGTWFPSWLQIGVYFIRWYCVVMDMYLYAGDLLYQLEPTGN